MKKILISLAALMSVTTMAKKLPVNLQVGISTGYDIITIKHEDFTKVGLGNIIKDDYKSNAITTGINFDVTYPLNFKKIKLNVGMGVTGVVTKPIQDNISLGKNESKLLYNSRQKKEEYEEMEKGFDEIFDKKADKAISVIDANNEKVSKTAIANNMNKNINEMQHKISHANYVKGKVEKDKDGTIKEYNDKIERNKKTINEIKEEIKNINKEIEEKIPTIKKKKEVINVIKKTSKQILMLLILNNYDIPAFKGEKIEDILKVYDEIKEELGYISDAEWDLKNEETSLKNSEEDLAIAKNPNEEINKYKAELSKLQDIQDKLRIAANKAGKEYDAYNEEYKKLTKEQNEQLEKLSKEDKKFYKEFTIIYNNFNAKRRVFELLNSSSIYGAKTYGIAEIEYGITKDVSVLFNTKLGLSITNNQLADVVKKLEKEKVLINYDDVYTSPFNKFKPCIVKPVIGFGIGAKYKNAVIELDTGLNTGLATLKVAVQF